MRVDGEAARAHLRRDLRLRALLDKAEALRPEPVGDVFAALAKGLVRRAAPDAFPFVWSLFRSACGDVSASCVLEKGASGALDVFGKKTAAALLGAAKAAGRMEERLSRAANDEAVELLCTLRGVDVETAIRALIALGRPDVLCAADGAACRALRRLYGAQAASPQGFAAFRDRCAPYGSTATLCLWAAEGERPVFPCSEEALTFLKRRDKRLGALIDRFGPVRRFVEPDLFTALVESVIAQQISGKAAQAISDRLQAASGPFSAEGLADLEPAAFQHCGLSARKAAYIRGLALAVRSGEADLEGLRHAPDQEVIRRLSAREGIGVWTAEMLLIFSLCRPDVLSWGDLGIRRGMALLYGDHELTRERFERRRKRYAPYGSVASLYLWALAGVEEPLARRLVKG